MLLVFVGDGSDTVSGCIVGFCFVVFEGVKLTLEFVKDSKKG